MPRFVDQTPTEVFATLPDEGVYLWRVHTMYRSLPDEMPIAAAASALFSIVVIWELPLTCS